MPVLANHSQYVAATEIVDHHDSNVRDLARSLAAGERDPVKIAENCFEWVRDRIQHSMDFSRTEVTCAASEVLAQSTGFCYAKSHLLAALLRANNIPAGFCYQRLSLDGFGPPYCLHGLNAVWLPDFGWYRVDARGNKPGVAAQFTPPIERLAFAIQFDDECELPGVYPEPLPVVVRALKAHDTVDAVVNNLPDLQISQLPDAAARSDS